MESTQSIKNTNYNEIFYALIFFASTWFMFHYFSGLFNYGYRMADDWRLIAMHFEMKDQGFLATFWKWLSLDLDVRFRPLYYVFQSLEVYFFGLNFKLFQIYHYLILVFTSFFLYRFLRLINFHWLESLLFPFLICLGKMSPVLWRLGVNEIYGFFLLSIALYFLGKNKKILFTIFGLLAANAKESFIILLPAISFLFLWITLFYRKEHFKVVIPSILLFFFMFLIGCFHILFIAGANTMSYSGFAHDLAPYISSHITLYHASSGALLLLFAPLFFIFSFKKHKRNTLFAILLFLAIIVPQIIMYAKTGIYERYLVPGSFGYAFLLLGILHTIRPHPFFQDKYKIKILALVFVIFLSLLDRFRPAYAWAKNYSHEGVYMQEQFNLIAKAKQSLYVTDPLFGEFIVALDIYIKHILSKNPLYLLPYISNLPTTGYETIRDETLAMKKDLLLKNLSLEEKKNIDLIFISKGDGYLEFFKEQSHDWFDEKKFKKSEMENFIIYSNIIN